MASFTVNVDIKQEGEGFMINTYLSDVKESGDGVESVITTLLANAVADKMIEVKEKIADNKLEDLVEEFKKLTDLANKTE